MNKTALITGASSGIGKEIARIHAKRGGKLVLVARREAKLQELAQQLNSKFGVQVDYIVQDLTATEAVQRVYSEVQEKGITIDYLINNAGFGGHGKFHEREWENDAAMIQLNIVVLTQLTRLFLPNMLQRNDGKILNVSSTASLIPGPLQAVYFATKAYVTSFSNAIYEELHDSKVTVTALLPGATETEFGAISGMDKTELFKRSASAQSVAKDGYNGMLEGKLNVISGLTLDQKIMMAFTPFTPKKLILKQIRKMQEIK